MPAVSIPGPLALPKGAYGDFSAKTSGAQTLSGFPAAGSQAATTGSFAAGVVTLSGAPAAASAAATTGTLTLGVAVLVGSPAAGSPAATTGSLSGGLVAGSNHHLRKTDGTLTEITDTVVTASQTTLEVGDPTGISVGDYVEIRRSSADDPPIEVTNPTLLATAGRSTVALTGQPGEGRNYAGNPFFFTSLSFAGPPTIAQVARVSSYDSGAPSLTIKDFEGPSDDITDGSLIFTQGANGAVQVDGDHTWMSGTLTVALGQAFGGTISADNPVYVWRPISIDGWKRHGGDGLDPTFRIPVAAKMTLSSGSWTAAVDATVTLQASGTDTTATWLTLKNFSGQALQAGDVIEHDSAGDRLVVVGRAEIDSTGDIGVPVAPFTTHTWTADDAVSITRPDWAQGYQGDRLAMWQDIVGSGGVTQAHGWVSEAVRVPFVSGWELRAHVRFATYNASGANVTITPGTGERGLALYLLDGSLTELADAEDAERTYTSDALEIVDLSVDLTPGVEDTYRLRIRPPVQTSGGMDFRLTVIPLEVSLSYGPSAYTLTHTEYSGTNKVYARMAARLAGLQHGRQMGVDVRDVAYEAGVDVRREKIIMGAPWYLRSDKLGLEAFPADIEGAIARVHRYTQDLDDPKRASVALDTDLFYLTRDT